MTLYRDLLPETYAAGEKNDCSVKALAIAANMPYRQAHEIMRKFGRKNRRGAFNFQILAAMRAVGLNLENISNHISNFSTVNRFEQFHGNIKGTFVIFVHNHVLVWKNGKTEDWSAHSRKRIQMVYYVHND